MTHLGLFAGIGGFELAARWAGWETVAVCEWDKFCQKVLKYHFPDAEQFSDIRTTEFTRYAGRIDVLTGGFPCQPYSTAGKRLGKDDVRHLWPQMLRAIQEIKPRWVVGENVRGLVSWNGGMVFDEVQSDLEAAGYEVIPFILPACGLDAPHRRDRVWFVAHAASLHDRGDAGKVSKTNGRPIREMFSEFGDTGEVFEFTSNATKGRLEGGHGKTAGGRSEPQFGIEALYRANNWQQFPTQPPVCSRNDGIPSRLAGITISRHRRESIKAYGNAIVPQVAKMIFNAINEYENKRNSNQY